MGKKKVAEKSETVKEESATAKSASPKASAKVKIDKGRIYIQASYNNTIITATDEKGNVLAWLSAGSMGFSGPKKSTPFAASKVAEALAEKLEKTGLKEVQIFVRGVGAGRDSSIRSFAAKGFIINSIKDVTPIPHNGPRPRKVRRV